MPEVWVVDDDESIRLILEESLKSDGSINDLRNVLQNNLRILEPKLPVVHLFTRV